jgi:hypothetical protein
LGSIILASVFAGRAKEESNYKRIQRFLRGFQISYALIAVLIVSMSGGAATVSPAGHQSSIEI